MNINRYMISVTSSLFSLLPCDLLLSPFLPMCTLVCFIELQFTINLRRTSASTSFNNKWTVKFPFSFFREIRRHNTLQLELFMAAFFFFVCSVRLRMWPRSYIGSSIDMHRGHHSKCQLRFSGSVCVYEKMKWVV